jgi:hypothetical protein
MVMRIAVNFLTVVLALFVSAPGVGAEGRRRSGPGPRCFRRRWDLAGGFEGGRLAEFWLPGDFHQIIDDLTLTPAPNTFR